MKKILLGMALCCATQAHAGFIGVEYEGIAGYKSYQTQPYRSDVFKPVIDKAEEIMAIEDKLYRDLEAEIREGIAGEYSLKGFDFQLNGPIVVRLDGLASGLVIAKVGGFSLDTRASIKKSWYADGSITVTSNTVWLTGQYNPYSGLISNLALDDNFQVNVDVDVDTILDVIPGFNAFFTNDIEDQVESRAENAIYNELNALQSYEKTIFGLDSVIPDDEYFYNGDDLGVRVKDKLVDIVTGESIEISLSDRVISNHTWNKVELTFSDRLYFIIEEKPRIITAECIPGRPCDIEP